MLGLLREFGFPTVVAVALGIAFWKYATYEQNNRIQHEIKMEKKLGAVIEMLRDAHSCPADDTSGD
jgi:hypothetical protein